MTYHERKTYKPYLPLKIQFFNDNPPGGNPPQDPPTDPPKNEPPNNPPSNEPPSNIQGLTLDVVQQFVNEDKDAKKWLQSLTDTRVTDAIKTYESKTLPKKLEDEISKRFPPESEEQKQLRELQQKFEQLEVEKQRESLRNKALNAATEKGVPTKLVDILVGKDEESTTQNLELVSSVIQEIVGKELEAKFKESGREPHKPSGNNDIDAQMKAAAEKARKTGRDEDRAEYARLKTLKEKGNN